MIVLSIFMTLVQMAFLGLVGLAYIAYVEKSYIVIAVVAVPALFLGRLLLEFYYGIIALMLNDYFGLHIGERK